jgi:uncharacterized protein (TIGR04255 family)
MSGKEFLIDTQEQYETLPKAPIVEAVIHWRVPPTSDLEPNAFLKALHDKLPEYPALAPQHKVQMGAFSGPEQSGTVVHRTQWHGWRFESADKLHVAQFSRAGLAFSRLRPYSNWEVFSAEGRRLWDLFCGIARPEEIERLGVRFINLIEPIDLARLGQVLIQPPKSPKGMKMPVAEFMHQSVFEIPGHPYRLNTIQTIRPADASEKIEPGLILDLDVATTNRLPVEGNALEQALVEMRAIKNQAFTSIVTAKQIDKFR